jgi:hypothetical protein
MTKKFYLVNIVWNGTIVDSFKEWLTDAQKRVLEVEPEFTVVECL